MTSVLYAAYGSNLHPVRLSERLNNPRLIGTGYLFGRGFRFNKRSKDNSGKGNIVLADEGVYLAIYELDKAEKSQLDKIEGLGFGYDEEYLEVPEFGTCVTYIAASKAIDDKLEPYCWYKRLVLLGCTFHDFPKEYIDKIRGHSYEEDRNAKRLTDNMNIVERIENGI